VPPTRGAGDDVALGQDPVHLHDNRPAIGRLDRRRSDPDRLPQLEDHDPRRRPRRGRSPARIARPRLWPRARPDRLGEKAAKTWTPSSAVFPIDEGIHTAW